MPDQPSHPPSADIQFDRAEFGAAAAGASCALCHQPIAGPYYSAGQKLLCSVCRDRLMASLSGGSRVVRFGRALIFGLGAGVLGCLLWWAVRTFLHMQAGLVAIVVGLMVGGAVRRGSNGRGGLAYQLVAVVLTYGCITAAYVPEIYQGLREKIQEDRAVAATQPVTETSGAPNRASTTAPSPTVDHLARMGVAGNLLLLALAALLLFAFALAAPILAGFQNIIGLLIIGFALWEAWKINRKVKLNLAGPFTMPAPAPAPVTSPISPPGVTWKPPA
jgi:hypothetical protein